MRGARPSGRNSASRVQDYWVCYDAAIREGVVYEHEPPASSGLGRYDIGPIELDRELVKEYTTAKEAWQDAHLRFVAAVREARGHDTIDWE